MCENPPKCRTNNGLIRYISKKKISKQTLVAMAKINRINYIPKNLIESRKRAYWNIPLSIGHKVTISQPSLVGQMIDFLKIEPMNNILEIGTGSSYNASIISELLPYGYLTTVERIVSLGQRAKKILKFKKNVQVIIGDAMNIKYLHPFDRIIVTAEFLDIQNVKFMLTKLAADFSICVFPVKNTLS